VFAAGALTLLSTVSASFSGLPILFSFDVPF
jgi:hypothetical protein